MFEEELGGIPKYVVFCDTKKCLLVMFRCSRYYSVVLSL